MELPVIKVLAIQVLKLVDLLVVHLASIEAFVGTVFYLNLADRAVVV